MKERIITGVYFNQNKDEPEVVKIENKLSQVQRLVEGYIELVNSEMFDNFDERISNLDIWINEEGRLIENFIPNITLNPEFGEESILYGSLVVLYRDNEGNFGSVPKERMDSVIDCLKDLRKKLEQ